MPHIKLKILTCSFIYHVRKEGRKEGGEWGRVCMHPTTQGGGEGRQSSWHTWESGDKHADRGREGTRRTDGKQVGWRGGGVGSAIHASLLLGPCVVKPNSALTAARVRKARLAGDDLSARPVKTFTFLLLPLYYSQKAAAHYVNRRRNIGFDEISTYIKCTETHPRRGPASNVNEDIKTGGVGRGVK